MTAISTEPKRQIDITIVRRWALGIGPGGHHFIILNVSINKKRFFVSYVVTYEIWIYWVTVQDSRRRLHPALVTAVYSH